ncbi:hypothetical protein, partial [Lysinibacillus agricola]|uniref:hypothetical protein n=1 Tax=Lysinibacillus agricola TaxID=2590012 RepID=UPI003C2ED471
MQFNQHFKRFSSSLHMVKISDNLITISKIPDFNWEISACALNHNQTSVIFVDKNNAEKYLLTNF